MARDHQWLHMTFRKLISHRLIQKRCLSYLDTNIITHIPWKTRLCSYRGYNKIMAIILPENTCILQKGDGTQAPSFPHHPPVINIEYHTVTKWSHPPPLPPYLSLNGKLGMLYMEINSIEIFNHYFISLSSLFHLFIASEISKMVNNF